MNDILTNKIQSIQRCVERAREEYQKGGDEFHIDYTHQDSSVLNVTRACEMTIDLANHIIKKEKLGIPTSSSESFSLLARKGIISQALEKKMIAMVSFRNIAVHEYKKLEIENIVDIIVHGLDDVLDFAQILRSR